MIYKINFLKDLIGPIEVNTSEVLKQFERDWKQEQEIKAGRKEAWFPEHYNMSELGHQCIRRLSYPQLKIVPPKRELSEKEFGWAKSGCMSRAIGKVVHSVLQASLQDLGILTQENTELKMRAESSHLPEDRRGKLAECNIVGKADGLLNLSFSQVLELFKHQSPQTRALILKLLPSPYHPKTKVDDKEATVSSQKKFYPFVLEIKTWNKDKLMARRTSRWGGDDYEKLNQFEAQIQPELFALNLSFGLLFTVNTSDWSNYLIENSPNFLPDYITFDQASYDEWAVVRDDEEIEKMLARAGIGTSSVSAGQLPAGENWLGDGFCPYVSVCPDTSQKCGKR